jgi:hypothetical protein
MSTNPSTPDVVLHKTNTMLYPMRVEGRVLNYRGRVSNISKRRSMTSPNSIRQSELAIPTRIQVHITISHDQDHRDETGHSNTSHANPATAIATTQSIPADREERGQSDAPRSVYACKCQLRWSSLHITASLVARPLFGELAPQLGHPSRYALRK